MAGNVKPDELRALYVDFSKASKVWSLEEYPLASKLACVLHDFLVGRLLQIVNLHPELPLLVSYQSDATPFLTRSRQLFKLGNQCAQRGGMALSELLLERGFVKASLSTGLGFAAIEIAPSRVLSRG